MFEENRMVNCIESLRDVKSDQTSPRGGFFLVEAISSSHNNGKEGSVGIPERPKTLLGGRKMEKRRIDKGKKKMLKDLDSRREERDGAVKSALVKGLARLKDRDDVGFLPYGREVSIIDREIEEFG